jgi:ABC-2 type transport system permease protein
MSRLANTLRAYPTLLRIGFSEMLAYRAEMLVWILATTMPLVNLAFWHTVAESGKIGRFGQPELNGYFLSAFIVRQLTGSWVVWEMNQEIRSGRFSMRLLRPLHPLIAYSAENVAAIPMRAALSLPVGLIALVLVGEAGFLKDLALLPAAFLAIFGSWLISFLSMSIMGCMAFFLESSMSLMYIWQALFYGLSGYFFPLEFLSLKTPLATSVLHGLPFYYMVGFPIEVLLGHHSRGEVLRGLGVEYAWVALLLTSTLLLWRAGIRRWNAYGA